jgi:hypothetical protein
MSLTERLQRQRLAQNFRGLFQSSFGRGRRYLERYWQMP